MTAVRAGWRRLAAWWRDQPIQLRLVVAATAAAAVAILAVVGIAWVAVHHELSGQLDSELRHQVSELQQQAQDSTGRGMPIVRLQPHFGEPGGIAQVVSADGQTQTTDPSIPLPVSSVDEAVAAGTHPAVIRSVTVDGTLARMATSPLLPGLAVQVALPERQVVAQLHRIAYAFLGLALAGVAAAGLLSWLVGRRIVAPVTRLTRTAEEIAATRVLTTRIAETRGDELGRLAAAFNTMLDALAQSLSAQRQLVADAGHELRTPLASLRTNVELLQHVDRLTPDDRAEIITAIVAQLEELTALVGDVVELARGEEPAGTLEDVRLDRLVEHAAARARRHWPSLPFLVDTAPVVVHAVGPRLDRAVVNLLDNAGKFSPPGAPVEVRVTAAGVLTVRDHGPGIPDEALPHVFDRFFRATEARALPGSGLGLAIVKQAVESVGGRITVGNAPDGGALATVTLPPVAAPAIDAVPAHYAEAP